MKSARLAARCVGVSRPVMTAIVVVIIAAAAARSAAAAPCEPAPVDPTLHGLLVVVDQQSAAGPLVPAPGSTFPAVSEDGTTIVDLFQDDQDFTGLPISTLATFTRRGRDASVEADGPMPGAADPPSPDEVAAWTRAVGDANALLAAHRWRTLPLAIACPAPGDDARTDAPIRLGFGGRLDITFDRATAELSARVRGATHRLAAHFGAPGTADADVGGGGCGEVTGVDRAYGARSLGFVVLVPRAQLGGDSCFGNLGVDDALVVALP
jgi:hypothetical protein